MLFIYWLLTKYLKDGKVTTGEAWKVFGVIVTTIVVCSFIGMSFTSVEVGHAVLVIDPIANTVSDPVLGEQWFLRMPYTRVVDIYYAMDTFEDTIPCFSSDQLEMQIQVLIRWEVDSSKLRDLYRKYPQLNYKDKAIESIMEETIRLITKEFTALETIEFRDVVANRIEESVFEEIRSEPSLQGALYHLEMDVKNIGYPPTYTASIEAKLVAEQEKIQADFERERILVLADAERQEAILRAEGFAESKRIEANGTLDAINTIISVNPDVDKDAITRLYMWLEGMKNLDIPVMIVAAGEDGIPIIMNLPTNSTTIP